MGQVAKLIMITPENNNKFYNMTENDNGTFSVEYGRVGANPQSQTYPMSKWQSTYNSKTKKGYVDNTELFIVEDAGDATTVKTKSTFKDFLAERTAAVVNIVKKLQGWAKGSIEENYTVSSEDVTQKQVDKAQSVLDEIVVFNLSTATIIEFNNMLLSFYGIVPRKMKQVKDHLIPNNKELNDLLTTNKNYLTERKNLIITEEQATLDVMAGQVKLNTDESSESDETVVHVDKDIISASGLDIVEVTDTDVINKIKSMMADNKNKFKSAFEIVNIKTKSMMATHLGRTKNTKTELLWHGSRNENWWSIMTSGLLIRPSNAVHSGSMFGDGIYFADKFQKSYGYSSGRNSYWAKGNANEAVLALYEVHVGEQKHIKKHDSSCYKLNHKVLAQDNFDSVFAHGGIDLRNNEYIVYQSPQSTIKYLVIVEA